MMLLSQRNKPLKGLMVLDIGCGAGTQARLWAPGACRTWGVEAKFGPSEDSFRRICRPIAIAMGQKAGEKWTAAAKLQPTFPKSDRLLDAHQAHGVDVNAPLIAVAQARAKAEGLSVRLDVGSATHLPYDDASMDVCLMPELLEHVQDWQSCLREAVRVLKPGGLLYVSTSNALCPLQNEFNLPFYSWYPGFAKRYFERLSITTRPDLVNYARYPAVHWFSYYGLKRFLKPLGMHCQDRFDVLDTRGRSRPVRLLVSLVKALPPLHLVGHLLTQGSTVWAFKQA